MTIQHLGMLVRLKKYLDEMVGACVPRGAFCDLDNKIVTRCNNHAKNLLSAIEDSPPRSTRSWRPGKPPEDTAGHGCNQTNLFAE